MSENTAAPITILQRIEVMTLRLRADRARRDALQHPDRENPMVAFAMGGGRAEIERLRADCVLMATVNAALAAKLAEAERTNAALASDYAAMHEEASEVAEVFGCDDTIGGESLSDYVRRQVAKLREAGPSSATAGEELPK